MTRYSVALAALFIGCSALAAHGAIASIQSTGSLVTYAPGFRFGQTFTAPANMGDVLSFEMTANVAGSPTSVEAALYEFDESTSLISGPALYTAPPVTFGTSPQHYVWTLPTPVTLQPGEYYVLSWDRLDKSTVSASINVELTGSPGFVDKYTGGQFIRETVTGMVWTAPLANHDLAFKLTYSTVPEPSVAAVAALLAALGRRRGPTRDA